MKVLTFSTKFPAGHPRHGEPTNFVEKVWNSFRRDDFSLPDSFRQWVKNFPFLSDEYLKAIRKANIQDCKSHTIRAGSRFTPGDMASLRVWSDKPYRSKQIEFAQVEVKKVWEFAISDGNFCINTVQIGSFIPGNSELMALANNDGLSVDDFWSWFSIHPKKQGEAFRGQIISWSSEIEYGKPALLAEKQNNE